MGIGLWLGRIELILFEDIIEVVGYLKLIEIDLLYLKVGLIL